MEKNWFPLASSLKYLLQKIISDVWKIDKIMTYTSQRIRFDQPECRTCLQILLKNRRKSKAMDGRTV